MASKFFLRNTAEAVDITPEPDSAWGDTASMVRAPLRLVSSGDALTTVTVPEAGTADLNVLARQYIAPLKTGQTITGAQAVQFVARFTETLVANNMHSAFGIRVIGSDGSTIRKVVLPVTREANEFDAGTPGTLESRNNTATSAAGNYTTVAGDYLVIEIGAGGNPTGAGVHDYNISLGDDAAAFLDASDVDTGADNPWVQMADTLQFVVAEALNVGANADETVSGLADAEASVTIGANADEAVSGLADAESVWAAGASADEAFTTSVGYAVSWSAGAEAGESIAGEQVFTTPPIIDPVGERSTTYIVNNSRRRQFLVIEVAGPQAGEILEAADAGAAFSAIATAFGSFSAPAGAGEAITGVAAALAAINAAADAGETESGLAAAIASLTAGTDAGMSASALASAFGSFSGAAGAAQASILASAMAQALAALQAGVEAGEAWAGDAAALAALLASADAEAVFAAVSESTGTGSITEGSEALASFLAAAQTIASIAASSNAAAVFAGQIGRTGLISATANTTAAFAEILGLRGAVLASAVASAAFSAQASAEAAWSASASASALFDYPAEIRMIVAGILITARIAGTPELSPAIKGNPSLIDS